MLRYLNNLKSFRNSLAVLQISETGRYSHVSRNCVYINSYFHNNVQLNCQEDNKKPKTINKLLDRNHDELADSIKTIMSNVKQGKVESALQIYKKWSKTEGFHKTDIVYLTLLRSLLSSKRIDDAKAIVIEFNSNEIKSSTTKQSDAILCSIFDGNYEANDFMWFVDNIIFTQKYCNHRILNIIMKNVLENANLDETCDLFGRIAHQFKKTPFTQPIACELINRNDTDNLEKILTILTKYHGQNNSILQMAFAFITCGRNEQAKRIFMSFDGNEFASKQIMDFIDNLKYRRQTKCLHNLLDATENYVSIECRTKIYSTLLELYANEPDTNEEIQKLVAAMIDEQIVPNDFEKSRKLLERKKIEMPQLWYKNHLMGDDEEMLQSHLRADDIEEANKFFNKCLESETSLQRKIIRYCLKKNAEHGRIDIFVQLNEKFDESTKQQLDFHVHECAAYIKAGECKKYMEIIESASSEQNAALKVINKQVVNMIESDKDIYKSYITLAKRFAANGLVKPICFAWLYNFVNDTNNKENDEIWDTYLKRHPTITCTIIPQILFKRKETEKLRLFLDKLDKKHTSKSELGRAYSYLIDMHFFSDKPNFQSIVKELKKATRYIALNDFKPNTLSRIKSSRISQEFWNMINKN
ncbi:uncharacterized protein LOC116341980 isoform X2 [Contarinia nasturtii]|uniref:uncharacterized protein LOC116341980 isoform X2 n=1 Tax=Contarinia nasturtii TaxID=265458 RepID=UPI0012D3BF12|nr:uncharacterized protein LOC116341980 isoform X2 [Contarinia nasturtii]